MSRRSGGTGTCSVGSEIRRRGQSGGVPFATGYLAHLGILARSAKPILKGLPLPSGLLCLLDLGTHRSSLWAVKEKSIHVDRIFWRVREACNSFSNVEITLLDAVRYRVNITMYLASKA
jgi:hypothetical protein